MLATGERGEARRHWQQALAVYTVINQAKADEVRAALAALDATAP